MSDTKIAWFEAPPCGPFDGGTVGGDTQVGTAWTRRFARRLPSGLFSVVDHSFYTVCEVYDDSRTVNGFEECVEFTVCTDLTNVGGTEVHGRTEYRAVYDAPVTDAGARLLCEALIVDLHDGWRAEDEGF